jgi:hypothetical protein
MTGSVTSRGKQTERKKENRIIRSERSKRLK